MVWLALAASAAAFIVLERDDVLNRLGLKISGKLPATDAGERIYAIGDVHGRLDLLRDLLKRVEEHHAALPPAAATHVILLGDLVDRGPDAAGVLKTMFEVQQRSDRIIVLKGNHEDAMVRAVDGEPGMIGIWKKIGGLATVRSFGFDEALIEGDPGRLIAALRAKLGRPMLDWLRNLPLTAQSGDYLFCHAGIRPGVPLKRQQRTDLLWIREDFLGDARDHGAVIVHGHSIATEVETRDNRIGIDTGAYRTGVLTALYLEGTERDIIATQGAPGVRTDERVA